MVLAEYLSEVRRGRLCVYSLRLGRRQHVRQLITETVGGVALPGRSMARP